VTDPYLLAIAILGGLLALTALVLAIVVRRYTRLRLELPARLREAREDAVARSTAVTRGQAFEHLAPFMDDFGYNPRDARFLGSPIDLVVFDGLGETDVREIVFVEVQDRPVSPERTCAGGPESRARRAGELARAAGLSVPQGLPGLE